MAEKRLIVVDVSNFIFRAFFAIRVLHSPEGVPVNAVHGVLNMFLKLLSKYRPTHMFLAKDTSGGSFRNEMYSEYKANRSVPPEDLVPQFELIQTLIEKMGFKYCALEEFEADDIIGSAAVQWAKDFDEVLIASGDKDLMQFVGGNIKMLDTMKDIAYDADAVFEKMGVRPDQIVDYLAMVGDASDNIPGMKGIGAKGAAKLLAEYDSLEKCIEAKDTFKGKKLTNAFENHLDDALLSKKLVQIVTDIDLGVEVDNLAFQFYPSDELIEYLRSLGFKTVLKKLEDMRLAEYHANTNDNNIEESNNFVTATKTYPSTEITTQDELKDLLKKIKAVSFLSAHSEYDGNDPHDRHLLALSISLDGESAFYISFDKASSQFGEKERFEVLKAIWGRDDLEVASEHWKRDFAESLKLELEVKAQRFDIVQAHFILNPQVKHELDFIAKEYRGYDITLLEKKSPYILSLEESERGKFCAERSCLIFQIAEEMKKELVAKELNTVYDEIDNPLIPVLARMELEGIFLNREYFEELSIEFESALVDIEKSIEEEIDGDSINLNSPKQVGELLFERMELPIIKKTKTGFSTDSEVLQELVSLDLSPIPGLILKYREMSKLLSTYVRALPELINPKTSKIHTTFNQHIAATGRLASSNPNLQNIPIRTELGKKVRKGFIATPGHLLLGADYSQVELRLLAHFSGDETMIKAFQAGQDIHRQTASEVLGIPLDEVTSEQRSQAKAVNFGLMYGQSSFGLSKQLRISRKEAKEYITLYFSRFSRVKEYLDTLKEEAEKTGYAQTFYGRKRFLPDIHSSNRTIKAMAERVAINSPIQGTAADIIKVAMIRIQQKIEDKNLKSRLILQVHDELIFEVPESELAEMKTLVREGMEHVVELSIPMKVDMGMGVNWLDLK